MKRSLVLVAGRLCSLGEGVADEELLALQKDDKQWAMAGKNYSSTRYSTLNTDHHRQREELQAGVVVLDGGAARPRGAPLVVGSTMYVHSSFRTASPHLRPGPPRKARRSSGPTPRRRTSGRFRSPAATSSSAGSTSPRARSCSPRWTGR